MKMNMSKQFGISLVEVLITLAILAGGIAALVKFQGDLLRGGGAISQNNVAIMIAQDKLDDLQHFLSVQSVNGQKSYASITTGETDKVVSGTSFKVKWDVTDQTNPDHKQVKVTVSWVNSKSETQAVVLNSIVGKIDPVTSGKIMQGTP